MAESAVRALGAGVRLLHLFVYLWLASLVWHPAGWSILSVREPALYVDFRGRLSMFAVVFCDEHVDADSDVNADPYPNSHCNQYARGDADGHPDAGCCRVGYADLYPGAGLWSQ